MEENATVKTLIEKTYQNIGFFNFSELNNHLQGLLNSLEKKDSNTAIDLSQVKTLTKNILSPMDNIVSYSTDNNKESVGSIEINIAIDELIENIGNTAFYTAFDEVEKQINNNAKDFEDIGAKEWYSDDIYYLNSKGIIEGYKEKDPETYKNSYKFKPAKLLSKAELITLLIRTTDSYELTESYYSSDCTWTDEEYITTFYDPQINQNIEVNEVFDDIINDQNICANWYSDYVMEAYRNGLIDKNNDRKFHPGKSINRAETAKIIARIINNFDLNIEKINTDKIKFKDVSSSSKYYKAIQTVYQYGIMTGTSTDSFSPNTELNRAEISTIVRRLLNAFEEDKINMNEL